MNIKEELNKLVSANSKTDWSKGVTFAIYIFFVICLILNLYLIFRPLSSDVKTIIDGEINAANINFDQETIDTLKSRQEPKTNTALPGGKNPFTPL